MKTVAFTIAGMCCAEETAALKRAVGPVVGGEEHLSFDLLNRVMTVEAIETSDIPVQQIQQAVATTGMKADLQATTGATPEPVVHSWLNGQTMLMAGSGLSLLAAFSFHAWLEGSLLAALGAHDSGATVPVMVAALYIMGIATGVWYVLPKAWNAVRTLRPDMNLLMVIAVTGALAIGEWFEAATVAFLFAFSLTLESWSVGRARRAVASLLELAPVIAHRKSSSGGADDVPPESVEVGETILIKPGERIPLDGRVLHGTSEINQAPVTGESIPVYKEFGDSIYAGTINGDGALEVVTTRPAGDTTLAHIIRLVQQAHRKRARSEQWVEKFARIYTPVIMALAVLVALVPPLAFGGVWDVWLYRSLVFLVIGCPCALVISTPVSIVAALATAARNGVLVKGGEFLEIPARLKAIALDKTGTLTKGEPAVVRVIPLNGHNEVELMERAAAMETASKHPLARAILAHADAIGVTPPDSREYQTLQGKGATAEIKGKTYWLGSHRYLVERGQDTPDVLDRLEQLAHSGQSIVAIGNNEHVCGLIAIADDVRDETAAAIAAIRAEGIEHIAMLTGDNNATAKAIAARTGVDEIHAELLPEDKVAVMEQLVARYGSVAMVGDGINDAPAMARASLGIAMGAAGSDAAIETADIALMSDDLSKIPWLIGHSKRTLAIIRQNVAFALGIKLLFVVLTFIGFASLWGAIAADMGASLLVIGNALRLLGSNSNGNSQNSAQGQTGHVHLDLDCKGC